MGPDAAFTAASGINATALKLAVAALGSTLALSWAAAAVVGKLRDAREGREDDAHITVITLVATLIVFLALFGLFLI